MLLSELSPGQSATILGFTLFNDHTQRLMSLGIIDGVSVDVVRRAPAGDPIEVDVMGDRISLRIEDARLINVSQPS
jgi:Fe2+ transport system protein FeoA